MTQNSIKIIIIFGGIDQENNISLSTIRSFIDHCDYSNHQELFYLNNNGYFYSVGYDTVYSNHFEDFFHKVKNHQYFTIIEFMEYLKNKNNILVFNTIHGLLGEDGQINQLLSHYNIPFTGCNYDTMEFTFDKFQFNNLMGNLGLKNIEYYLLPKNQLFYLLKIYNNLNDEKKYLLKPRNSGSSLGVYLLNSKQEIWQIIINLWKNFGDIIIEEYFEGIEFSIAVVDNNWNWPVFSKIVYMKTQGIYSYEKKYMINDGVEYHYNFIDNNLENEIKNHCINICKQLNIRGIIRIDGIIQDNKYIINDFNSYPAIDQNSLLFKTGIGTLKEIFNGIVEKTIDNYYPNLKIFLENYKLMYHNSLIKEKYLTTIKNFLKKIGHQDVTIVDNLYNNPGNIKIITGGNSNEKNVALLSGSNVFLQLSNSMLFKPQLYCWHQDKIYLMEYKDCGFNTVKNLIQYLKNGVNLIDWINSFINQYIFLGVHGGDGENGVIQNLLKNNYYNGSNQEFSQLFMDKYGTSLKFHGQNSYPRIFLNTIEKKYRFNQQDTFDDYIKNINWMYYETIEELWQILYKININGWCWKPNNDGSSVGICIIKNFEDFKKYYCDGNFIIEQLIKVENSQWIELTVGFIGNYCLNPSITISKGEFLSMEEKFQYGLGINLTESNNLSYESLKIIKNFITEKMKQFNFNSYCRIDIFFNKKNQQVFIIEVNSLPALTPATVLFHQGALEGLNQRQLLEIIFINDLLNKKSYNFF
jgi:D-alanine--D-alanine ligase